MGAEPQLREISYLPVLQGRWLNEMDETQRRNVIVLGAELVKTLFLGRPALGAAVLLNGCDLKWSAQLAVSGAAKLTI